MEFKKVADEWAAFFCGKIFFWKTGKKIGLGE